MTKLTTHERVLKRNIKEIEMIIQINKDTLSKLKMFCLERGHKIIPRDPDIKEKLKIDRWVSTSAICAICGTCFGWWCPNAPNHVCQYSKTEDSCDYCGIPQERK